MWEASGEACEAAGEAEGREADGGRERRCEALSRPPPRLLLAPPCPTWLAARPNRLDPVRRLVVEAGPLRQPLGHHLLTFRVGSVPGSATRSAHPRQHYWQDRPQRQRQQH